MNSTQYCSNNYGDDGERYEEEEEKNEWKQKEENRAKMAL